MLERSLAETYAGWFRALADTTRVQILHLLAEHRRPMTVGQIVERVPVGQSTVSAHLKVLTEARFVLLDRRGTSSWYRVNQRCVSGFPSAADLVMGKPATPFAAVACDDGTTSPPSPTTGASGRAGEPRPDGEPVRITEMRDEHAEAVLAIYQAGLDTGNASFETTAPTWDRWDAAHPDRHRFVALDEDDRVVGWIAAAPVSSRCVYAGVLEHSVYVDSGRRGRGIGRALLATYIAATEAAGVWTLQTGIFPENLASLALHRHAGFRTIGLRERIGRHHGHWRDVVFVERRATLAAETS